MTERVLITGARAPAALDLARSFRAAGFEVHMADCAPSRMASFSRAVAQVHRYPSPRAHFPGFAQAIIDLMALTTPIVVIPTCEEVFYLGALGNELVFAPDAPTLRRLHSKHLFAEDAASLDLVVPTTILAKSAADLEPHLADADNFVFKPEYSRFGTQTLVGPSRDAVAALCPSETAAWVVQQRVRGSEVSFYAASVNSRLVAFSAYRSPWKFEGGAGYAFETLDDALHDRLLQIAEVLAQKLIRRGQFACDVIVDANGTPWLLECNPRATSGVHLFNRTPELALALLGRRDTPLLAADAAPKHIGPALWSFGLATAWKRARLKEWNARRAKSADVISAPDDSAPIMGAIIDTARLGARAIARGVSLTEASTADIEWNGEAL
jgi:hypothetical protein